MLLAASAGGLAGALIASGTLVLTDGSSGSSGSRQPTAPVQATSAAPVAQGDISAILAKDVPAVVAITTDAGRSSDEAEAVAVPRPAS